MCCCHQRRDKLIGSFAQEFSRGEIKSLGKDQVELINHTFSDSLYFLHEVTQFATPLVVYGTDVNDRKEIKECQFSVESAAKIFSYPPIQPGKNILMPAKNIWLLGAELASTATSLGGVAKIISVSEELNTISEKLAELHRNYFLEPQDAKNLVPELGRLGAEIEASKLVATTQIQYIPKMEVQCCVIL